MLSSEGWSSLRIDSGTPACLRDKVYTCEWVGVGGGWEWGRCSCDALYAKWHLHGVHCMHTTLGGGGLDIRCSAC